MINIIYEDKYVIVINKPAGLVVHGDGRTDEPNVCDWALKHFPEIAGVGEPMTLSNGTVIDRPGIVHRLDRETSGVMILAKTQESFEFLKEQFKERQVSKKYNAFVYDPFKETEGVIDRPIGKSKKDFRQWSAQRGARGVMREAVTEYTVLKTSPTASFLEVRPQTGRTHQIRVHMKAVNHPVVADRLYATKRGAILGFKRLALHASQILVTLPSGEQKEFEAPLPADFKKALELFAM